MKLSPMHKRQVESLIAYAHKNGCPGNAAALRDALAADAVTPELYKKISDAVATTMARNGR